MSQPTDKETYQFTATAGVLYYAKNNGRGVEREDSILEVKGGTVNIYGSLSKPTTPVTDMTLDKSAFEGIDIFASVPTWLYFEVDTGSPIITLSSIELEVAE